MEAKLVKLYQEYLNNEQVKFYPSFEGFMKYLTAKVANQPAKPKKKPKGYIDILPGQQVMFEDDKKA